MVKRGMIYDLYWNPTDLLQDLFHLFAEISVQTVFCESRKNCANAQASTETFSKT